MKRDYRKWWSPASHWRHRSSRRRRQVFDVRGRARRRRLRTLIWVASAFAVLAGVLAGMAAGTAVVWLEIASLERRLGGILFGEPGVDRLYLR